MMTCDDGGKPTRSSCSSNIDGWKLSASEWGRTTTDSRKTAARPPPRDGPLTTSERTALSTLYPAGAMSLRIVTGVSDVNHVSNNYTRNEELRSCQYNGIQLPIFTNELIKNTHKNDILAR